MKARLGVWLTALTVIVVLALPGRVAAQREANPAYPYILIDLGTFGGPQSSTTGPTVQLLTNSGLVTGGADTPITDTDYPNGPTFGPDPYIQHAFLWHSGVLTDLGALPGNNSSWPNWLNARGDVAGSTETGAFDLLVGIPAAHATLWHDGRLIDLGTFGGYESGSLALNDRDQVVGFAANTIPDPFSLIGLGVQTRAFLWQDGHMHDIGTLGGPDAWPQAVNNHGQIAGFSYTSAISNPTTGLPTQDPFLWQDGHMRDLGTLGGTISFVSALNNGGEVVGQSNLAADQTYHPFLWDGHTLQDLGTLGGDNGNANWLNEAGDVVGVADLPGSQMHHGFLWRRGVMTDLGTLPGQSCTNAYSINAWDQVVGNSGICNVGGGPPFLWQHGTMYNLQSLVAPSALQLTGASAINDRGEIAGTGVFSNGQQHAVLLVPAGLAASEGITSNAPAPDTTGPATATRPSPMTCTTRPAWWVRWAHGSYRPCLGA